MSDEEVRIALCRGGACRLFRSRGPDRGSRRSGGRRNRSGSRSRLRDRAGHLRIHALRWLEGINTLTADGKFSNAVAGGDIETGTWGQEGGLSCLTPDEGEKRCYTFTQPDAEGNFTGTMADGVTVTVKKTA